MNEGEEAVRSWLEGIMPNLGQLAAKHGVEKTPEELKVIAIEAMLCAQAQKSGIIQSTEDVEDGAAQDILDAAQDRLAAAPAASLGQTLGGAPRAELETAIDEALVQRLAEFAASLAAQGGEDGGATPDASSGEVGGAAPDASSGGKKKTRRGGKKKKKPASEPATESSLDYSKSKDREPSFEEIAGVRGDLFALSDDARETVVNKLKAVCPEAIKGIQVDKYLPDIDYEAMDNRTFHVLKAEVESHLPLELLELELPVAIDALLGQLVRDACGACYRIFHVDEVPERFEIFVQCIRDYAAGSLSTEDLSARLADLLHIMTSGTNVKDLMLENIIDSLQRAYPAEIRQTRAAAEAAARAEAEAAARAEAEAARPPKLLTGAAALLQTLDEFKAQNGGVDDPYYANMRSALEELDIEERGECPEGA